MRTSERLTEQEIMRCLVNGGPTMGRHLAALERQKWALAASERHAASKANTAVVAAPVAERRSLNGFHIRLSHWLGVKLISAGHRLAAPAA